MLDTLKNRIHDSLNDVAWYQASMVRDITIPRVLNWVVSEVDDKIYEYIKRQRV